MCLYEEDQDQSWGPCRSGTLPPKKVPFFCTMCGVQKLSAKTAKKHKKKKHPSSKLNKTMIFTGAKQRVEFTSKHVHEVPTEPTINDVGQFEQVSEQWQKRKVSPEPEEHNRTKMRRVLDFDVVTPPTSPDTEMSLPPTPRDPFKQGTTPDNTNDPFESQLNSPAKPSPHPWGFCANTKWPLQKW